jgi:hypothetical protein
MKRAQIKLVAVIFLLSTLAAKGQSADPGSVVRSFYQYDSSHSQVFSKNAIQSRRRWFTDVLHLQLTKELERQAEFTRKNPDDKPHFGDGLPFRPLDELCGIGGRSYRFTPTIGRPSMRGSAATVPVRFAYPKDCTLPTTQYLVRLHKVKNAWYINDIEYPDGSTLLADLMREQY